MSLHQTIVRQHSAKPFVVRVGLGLALGIVTIGAVYLYSVRGTAILFDLASGMAGMFCF
jgi:hypothetical protein